jgi:hypothetical protein
LEALAVGNIFRSISQDLLLLCVQCATNNITIRLDEKKGKLSLPLEKHTEPLIQITKGVMPTHYLERSLETPREEDREY